MSSGTGASGAAVAAVLLYRTLGPTLPHGAAAAASLWPMVMRCSQINADGVKYRFAVYAYRVRAVNAKGLESGPSPYVLTIPSSPQWFYSQEAGDDCRLKWTKNPEAGIRGYRVYRMDGRWDADPIARLTSEPVDATSYADEDAGEDSHRYYVIAVDALGQEGFPSAPVWSNREWRPFYEPFVGQWHQ